MADFNRVLGRFNADQGAKVALTIHKYHQENIEPRLAALEWYATPFYRKAWIRLRQVSDWVWSWGPLGRFRDWVWSWVPRIRRLDKAEQTTVPDPDGSPTTKVAPESSAPELAEPPPPPSVRDAEGHLITPESDEVPE